MDPALEPAREDRGWRKRHSLDGDCYQPAIAQFLGYKRLRADADHICGHNRVAQDVIVFTDHARTARDRWPDRIFDRTRPWIISQIGKLETLAGKQGMPLTYHAHRARIADMLQLDFPGIGNMRTGKEDQLDLVVGKRLDQFFPGRTMTRSCTLLAPKSRRRSVEPARWPATAPSPSTAARYAHQPEVPYCFRRPATLVAEDAPAPEPEARLRSAPHHGRRD